MALSNETYEAICAVIDRVKTDERTLDTDQYAGMVVRALANEGISADDFSLAWMHAVAADAGADLSNEAVKSWARAEANGLSNMIVRAISAYMSHEADPIPEEGE